MALSLGVRKGDKIFVGDTQITVLETRGFDGALIEVGAGDGLSNPAGSCRQRIFALSDQKATEVLKDVFVSCGKPDDRFVSRHAELVADYRAGKRREDPGTLLPRLIFEAPRSITILREELYRRGAKESTAKKIAQENDIPLARARALVR